MRFIDVEKDCIVERRDAVKCVALSYVWGAAATLRLKTMNQERMRTPGVLSDLSLPATISDAIDLVKACGEQYLWVDALCIVQNDAEDLEAGTYAMDLICKSEFSSQGVFFRKFQSFWTTGLEVIELFVNWCA